jgi:RNA polymerase sigma-70 factor, ECF subfamily
MSGSSDGPRDLNLPESELIQRFVVQNDQQAFSVLVLRFQAPLLRHATRLCKGDTHAAEDLVQETFLKAFLALGTFRAESKLSTWLHRIIFNLAMQSFRRYEPSQSGYKDYCSLEEIIDLEDTSQPIESADAIRDITAAMQQVNSAQQRVILLCLVGGHSREDAADMTGMPLGTVKTNLRRGKIQLRKQLAAWREAA